MASTAATAIESDGPRYSIGEPRHAHLEVVPEPPRLEEVDQAMPPLEIGPADVARLTPAARHRLLAFIHSQLADLEEMDG
ncbi:hypothetical protein [Nocardia thailandica]|uniref:hypothetical protein n=1 Tax=Nocardia thailandica TaxID=257275 RepID=UPI000301BAE8|nr:hypothetical protein [Nocardia thailandica]